METVQLARDIAVIVFVVAALPAIVISAFVLLRLYWRMSPLLEDLGTTARATAFVSEFLTGPVAKSAVAVLAALGAAGGAAVSEFMKARASRAERNDGGEIADE